MGPGYYTLIQHLIEKCVTSMHSTTPSPRHCLLLLYRTLPLTTMPCSLLPYRTILSVLSAMPLDFTYSSSFSSLSTNCANLLSFISFQYQLTSHYTTSHHIISHHITSHHIPSHHITPHHITSHHTTPHHITPHINYPHPLAFLPIPGLDSAWP